MKIKLIFLFISLSFGAGRFALAVEQNQNEKKYSYNEGFLVGNAKSISIDKLSEDQITTGDWSVDVYLNNEFIYNKNILFYENDKGQVVPCLTQEDIDSFNIKPDFLSLITSNGQCEDLQALSNDVQIHLKQDVLRLDILIPQAMVEQYARGYVPISSLNEGVSALFMNYNVNGYSSRSNGEDEHSAYGNISAGLNLGLYRIRHQSSMQYNQNDKFQHESIRTYVQRAFPEIESELTAGQSFTSGSLFDSFSYTGAELATDNRMRPQSLQGFAPTVRGIANSNARVKIIQNGYTIYETNVSPGEFVINDLYATGYGGDLIVEVTEANGSVSTFIVPFSTVPGLLRPGQIDYSIVSGELRGPNTSSNIFVQSTVQYGLSNILTPFVGMQYSNKYQSGMLGFAVNTYIGAFSFDMASSKAELNNDKIYKGARARVTWNKDIQATSTNIALAGYRYESQDYLSLYEADTYRDSYLYNGESINPRRAQYILTVNQNLLDYGTVYVSGSLQTWRDNLPDSKQLQAGYMNNFKGIGYSFTYMKMYRNSDQGGDNNYMLSVTVPFSLWYPEQNTTLTSSVTRSDANDRWSNNTSVSSSFGEDNSISWNATASDIGRSNSNFSGNIQKEFSLTAINAGYSQGRDYKSFSAGANGALVVYEGGIIPSRYLGDTFAIIEAEGGEGASVSSWNNIVLNKRGQAVVPSLMPYQYNTLYLNSENMSSDVEIDNNMAKVAPYAGSISLVKFKTQKGNNITYRIILSNNKSVPFGSDIYDENNNKVGLVGQGGLVHFNATDEQGLVFVKWGDANEQRCKFSYKIKINKEIPEATCYLY
ncbi:MULTISPECIES: fimbria/pilus outer membrane usher protein [Providencia]|uniref:Fimbrial biogenesis outer membrane usher protein n=2 Tax=Providencia manganoxydans TaxID=2923283 RepID=A0ABX7AGK9_9GAMM|nr:MULTISPECIES: fimbria/pilus outer membrane usher protein [Providencia]MDX4945637.1 fimbria/pilus outer membrane usher protein [Providencia manganoxydans]QQO63113.1 fimbrial biogenesis outer membrane usher protein [Providencia manganoxydans]HEF8774023.1 fimbrial biogenesis outer membrane usher protein [Providencia stuartii]